MINYKNTQEGYEADCTTYSHIPGGRLEFSQTHQETDRAEQKVNKKESQWNPVFCFCFLIT